MKIIQLDPFIWSSFLFVFPSIQAFASVDAEPTFVDHFARFITNPIVVTIYFQ